MAYTITSDISRMITATNKEVFTENYNAFPVEWPSFMVKKSGRKRTEYFDSMSNIAGGQEKPEGGNITYQKIEQAYQTAVTSKTWANGFAVSLEATKFDLDKVLEGVDSRDLARTMRDLEEARSIKRVDEALTTNLSDGQPLATNSRPLKNAGGQTNDTLATASSLQDPDNHKTMINMFADFKNHAGGKTKCIPEKGLTHYKNMMDIEEVYRSINKANEFSNTKNVLPSISWVYSHYISDENAWMMWDTRFDHLIYVEWMGTSFDQDEDKISTKNLYYNAIAMYETAAMPFPGLVYNAGA